MPHDTWFKISILSRAARRTRRIFCASPDNSRQGEVVRQSVLSPRRTKCVLCAPGKQVSVCSNVRLRGPAEWTGHSCTSCDDQNVITCPSTVVKTTSDDLPGMEPTTMQSGKEGVRDCAEPLKPPLDAGIKTPSPEARLQMRGSRHMPTFPTSLYYGEGAAGTCLNQTKAASEEWFSTSPTATPIRSRDALLRAAPLRLCELRR